MNDHRTYHCIDRLNCIYSDCRFHVICMKYMKQRDAELLQDMDAYIENLDDEHARIITAREG